MSSLRTLFLNTDPAQSVESGISMRKATVNDVFRSQIGENKPIRVKDVLQSIHLETNHRTHAQNLAMAMSIRRILARSFQIPIAEERALIVGELPQTLLLEKISQLADKGKFCGGNVVFIAPDDMVAALRKRFLDLEIENDVFGVREAKGLEFDAVAVVGFLSYFEKRGSERQWQNVLNWLHSDTGLTTTTEFGLDDCDYRLSFPQLADEAMAFYTAITRARNQLYLIEANDYEDDEVESGSKGKKSRKKWTVKNKGSSLADYAFRKFAELSLTKAVQRVAEGQAEMTSAQHKVSAQRRVLLIWHEKC